jgi:hypothetical protein
VRARSRLPVAVLGGILAVALVACSGSPDQRPSLGPSESSPPVPPVAPSCPPAVSPGGTGSWQTHEALSGAFTFDYPSGWTDESGDIGTRPSDLLAPETIRDLGLDDEPVDGDVVQDPAADDNLGAFQVSGGDLDTATVYARQEDLVDAFVNFEITRSDLEECVGGTPALGLEISGERSPGEGTRVQHLFYLVRGGVLYVLYVDAADQAGVTTFHKVLRTWTWTEEAASPDGAAVSFRLTGTTQQIDPDADKPDGFTFSETFPAGAERVYVVYMCVGGDANVKATFAREGTVIGEGAQRTPRGNWGFFFLPAPEGGFRPGEYQVQLEIQGTEVIEQLEFRIEA